MLDDRSYMRSSPYGPRWSATVILILVNTVVYAVQIIADQTGGPANAFERYLALSPKDLAHGWVWQLLTFQFLHDTNNALHLILNCAMIYMFGRPVEAAVGWVTFLRLYFISGIMGGLFQAACSWLFQAHFGMGPVVGASAGLFGLIAAFAVLNWEQPVTTLVAFILPVTMRAKYLVLVMGIIALLGMLSKGSQIAHAAHLGGLLTGLLYARLLVGAQNGWFNWQRFRPKPRPRELVQVPAARQPLWQRVKKTVPEDLPPAEFISREVDPILDKISAHGIQSLTERERKILEAARAKMAKR